ncbi:Protein KLP-3 a [Aphelenchoides avenae]|nr:Protein KLP-3 a [Aphelenchus avenae]
MEVGEDEYEVDSSAMFTSCNCDHQLRKRDYELRQSFLQSHVETKDRLIKSLELIIDEQEGEINELKAELRELGVDGTDERRKPRKVLKGISYLSLDFGHLSNEILELKDLLRESQMESRRLQIRGTQQNYSNIPILVDSCCQTEMLDVPQTETLGSSCSSISSGASTPIIPADPPHVHVTAENETLHPAMDMTELRKELSLLIQEKAKLKEYYQQQVNDAFEEVRSYLLSLIPRYISKLTQRYEEEVRLRKALHDTLVEIRGNIRVFCRIRPSSTATENASLQQDTLDNDSIAVQLDSGSRRYLFDKVFSESATQLDIYAEVSPLIRSCLDGKNVSMFAYGHTGSGKTYTMDGPENNPGIGQRALIEIFRTLDESSEHLDYEIHVSMIEIYNEKIRDLLGNDATEKPQLRMDADGRQEVRGIVRRSVESLEAVNEILREGRRNRSVAATALNANSSRSHAVIMVTVNMRDLSSGTTSTGRLNLIDLAGSERVAKSQATGAQLKEAQFINKSLSELGNVVSALRRQQSHIPFRNCLLTRVLQDSLNGDSKTLMIVQVAAETSEFQESLSSLNFAEKVGNIVRPKPTQPNAAKEAARKKLERRMTMDQ